MATDFKIVKKKVGESTIIGEMQLMYTLANAVELLNQRINNRIRAIYRQHGYTFKESEPVKGLHDYCKFVRQATFQFQSKIEPTIIQTIYEAEDLNDGKGCPQAYDQFHKDTNELIRIMMLYTDRTWCNKDNENKVYNYLNKMTNKGKKEIFFEKEDIDYYKVK